MSVYKKTISSVYHYIATLLLYKLFVRQSNGIFIIYKADLITPEHLRIGKNVVIRHHARIEGINKYAGVNFDPQIIIGDNVRIQQNLHLTCASKITIGRHTAIAANVSITDINHGYEDINIPPEEQPLQIIEVTIGEACKIYNNVVILPGTVLGKHNIVGANSVVRGVFPDYSVIVGAPAKIVKRYNVTTRLWEKTDEKGNFI
jgi:acetyltransferase-like isoleucine patch superfamily enzyme